MEPHSSQSEAGDPLIDQPDYWGPMQKGNEAFCEGNFAWAKVDQVILHDQECQFSIMQHNSFNIKTSFSPVKFSIGALLLLKILLQKQGS